ncbi:MAG: EAL domain-containing protein [Bacilli bacterium]|nr:EAL domain-containing protein [Bacilli bacterium]
MRKTSPVRVIFICLFSALAGISLGVSLAILARPLFAKSEPANLDVAFYCLVGGIVATLIAALIAFIRPKAKGFQAGTDFLQAHPELLDKDEFLRKANSNPTRPIGVANYLVLSNLSEEEKQDVAPRLNELFISRVLDFFPKENSCVGFIPPHTIAFFTNKGDIKAKMEEVGKQAIANLALDPTLPNVRLLFGLEASEERMEPALRLSHASMASSYDSISRLSGSLASYDKGMEIRTEAAKLGLDKAMEEERLEVGYIPLLSKTNKTYAFLRTLRLFSPSRGLIEEEELRRLSDNAGESDILDEFALDRALDDLVTFDEGVRHKLNMMILSIGRGTFYRASWLQTLRKKCAQREIDVSRLCLAIEGRALETDEAYCASFSKKAHALGIKTAILGFSPKCPMARMSEILPDVVDFAPSFFQFDPVLGKAEITVLKNSAKTIASTSGDFGTIPDLYPTKEVTPSVALEHLQEEEEFLR